MLNKKAQEGHSARALGKQGKNVLSSISLMINLIGRIQLFLKSLLGKMCV